jgi:hypothetical protein
MRPIEARWETKDGSTHFNPKWRIRLTISLHRPVAVGHLVEVHDAVEDAAGLDPALENVRQELFDARAHRGRLSQPPQPPPLRLGRLGICLKDTNLCLLTPVLRYGYIERTRPLCEQRCASPLCCVGLAF